jgi:hypothetical protein
VSQSSTPTFDEIQGDNVEVEQPEDGDVEDTDLDLEVNDDANLDVEVLDDVDEVPDVTEGAPKPAKPTAATTPRTKAPDGYVKPVEFARLLSAHLGKTVPPQVVYSYIKNNGPESKNPFPTHSVGGYDLCIKPEEGLAWWDAKNTRVSASKAATAQKAAAKAAKAAAPQDATPAEATVTEAE